VGTHNGHPFFSLEFVGGGSLDRKLSGTPQPARDAAQLVETLARAMQVAHQRGIVHRDLKPSNVLLGEDGTPKITDFGLAKQLDSDVRQTQSGAIVGTPSYMAPEQAGGKNKQIGPLCDVYALGAILYELLTGRPPFRADTPLDTVLQVLNDEPVPPCRLLPKIPRDLETICLKAMAKAPAHRYPNALELADDLGRFLRYEPIRARPIGTLRRVWTWTQKRPWTLTAAASLLVTAALCLSYGLWAKMRHKSWDALYREAQVARLNNRADKSLERLQEAAAIRRDARLYDEAIRVLQQRGRFGPRFAVPPQAAPEILPLYDEAIRVLQQRGRFGPRFAVRPQAAPEILPLTRLIYGMSQDGRLLLIGRDYSYKDHTARYLVVDLVTKAVRWSAESKLRVAALDPQGHLVATQSKDDAQQGVMRLWDVSSGQMRGCIPISGGAVKESWFAPGGPHLVIRTEEQRDSEMTVTQVAEWNVQTMKLVSTIGPLRLRRFDQIAFAPEKRLLATSCWDEKCTRLWNAHTGDEIACWPTEEWPLLLAFSPDGKSLACLSVRLSHGAMDENSGGQIEVREISTGRISARLSPGPDASPWYIRERRVSNVMGDPLCFTPDSRFLIAGSGRWMRGPGNVHVWDVGTGQESLRLPGRALEVTSTNGTLHTLLTLGEGKLVLFPVDSWHMEEIRRELDASGLASSMRAPSAEAGEGWEGIKAGKGLKFPYPLNLLEDQGELLSFAVRLSPLVLSFGLCNFGGIFLSRRRRQGQLPSSRTLASLTGAGLLAFVFGFYQLITLLNTPGWTWPDFGWEFGSFWGCVWSGLSVILEAGSCYRTALFGIEEGREPKTVRIRRLRVIWVALVIALGSVAVGALLTWLFDG
jgi:hypothetical protein